MLLPLLINLAMLGDTTPPETAGQPMKQQQGAGQ